MTNDKLSIKETILSRLMFASELSYSELQKGISNHDLFNYHLKQLRIDGLIEKSCNTKYILTSSGKQRVALMEEDGSSQKPFKVGLFIALVRQKDGNFQMYLYKRLKHPHYGYSGDITAKLQWGQSLTDNLQRELEEELGIQATKFDLLGVFKKTFRDENNSIMGEGVYFQYIVTEFVGHPSTKNLEGEYYWCNLDDILSQEKIFKETLEFSLPQIKSYLAQPHTFTRFVVEQGQEKLKY